MPSRFLDILETRVFRINRNKITICISWLFRLSNSSVKTLLVATTGAADKSTAGYATSDAAASDDAAIDEATADGS